MFFVLAEDDLLAVNRGHSMVVTLHAYGIDAICHYRRAGPLLLCSPDHWDDRYVAIPITPFTIIRRMTSGASR
jgi:hypothetical protein